jgi:poly [ADP-ribose] polymerase 6/8
MAILSSPEKEEVFSGIRAKTGSFFLWHGSGADRWHSIIRTGLRNATGTTLERCGHSLGPGIYFAREATISWAYSAAGAHLYANSVIGASVQIISLCEVDKISSSGHQIVVKRQTRGNVTCKGFLKDHGWAHTLTMEEACVIRFLMVGGNFSADVVARPPAKILTLREVLEHHAKRAQ